MPSLNKCPNCENKKRASASTCRNCSFEKRKNEAMPDEFIICNACNIPKTHEHFYKKKNFPVKTCKDCQKKHNSENYHSLSDEEKKIRNKKSANRSKITNPYYVKKSVLRKWGVDESFIPTILDQFSIQKNCDICNRHVNEIGTLQMDHDHATMKYRGLLCIYCNHALGNLQDDIDLFKKAIDYLESNRNNPKH